MDDKIVAAVAAVEVREVEEQEETDLEQPERIEKVVENSMDYYGSSGKSPDKENVGDEELAATPIPERLFMLMIADKDSISNAIKIVTTTTKPPETKRWVDIADEAEEDQ